MNLHVRVRVSVLYKTLSACDCGNVIPQRNVWRVCLSIQLKHSCHGNLVDRDDLVIPMIGCERKNPVKTLLHCLRSGWRSRLYIIIGFILYIFFMYYIFFIPVYICYSVHLLMFLPFIYQVLKFN